MGSTSPVVSSPFPLNGTAVQVPYSTRTDGTVTLARVRLQVFQHVIPRLVTRYPVLGMRLLLPP